MGQLSNTRIIILASCLILTSALIFTKTDSKPVYRQTSLQKALSKINGCEKSVSSPLEQNIVDALMLDDYLNQNYLCSDNRVSLYIGYYYTTKKVGAAHDPMVCFPGQGWLLSDKEKHNLVLDDNEISYAMMTATRGEQKELIVYWFQSYDKSNPDTFSQKIASLVNKMVKAGEDNAFVRITMPIGEKTRSECHEAIISFMREFYPVFENYIKEDINS
ncbi:MAG: EpsI family protein [Proteobacteria bacterium]|nr:EpsI family protein [Pseudomonadota bacterium]